MCIGVIVKIEYTYALTTEDTVNVFVTMPKKWISLKFQLKIGTFCGNAGGAAGGSAEAGTSRCTSTGPWKNLSATVEGIRSGR